jgi:hypothetical protein
MTEQKKLSPLQYIKQEMGLGAQAFMAEWKTLTKEDQDEMKQWAQEEMDAAA